MQTVIMIQFSVEAHCCTCLKPGPGIPLICRGFLFCSLSQGDRWLFLLLTLVELLTIIVYTFFS